MSKVLYILTFPFRLICYGLIYFYKFVISPILPKNCRYYPTCSSYTLQYIKEFGILKGIYFGAKRICRCVPWKEGGEDYVPFNIKGENKWIF